MVYMYHGIYIYNKNYTIIINLCFISFCNYLFYLLFLFQIKDRLINYFILDQILFQLKIF